MLLQVIERIERIAGALRDKNEPGVDIHEGGYYDAALEAFQAIEKVGLRIVEENDLKMLKHPTSRKEFAGGYLFQEAMERLTERVEI